MNRKWNKNQCWVGAEAMLLLSYGCGSMLRHWKFRFLCGKEKLKCFTGARGLQVACVGPSHLIFLGKRLMMFLPSVTCVGILWAVGLGKRNFKYSPLTRNGAMSPFGSKTRLTISLIVLRYYKSEFQLGGSKFWVEATKILLDKDKWMDGGKERGKERKENNKLASQIDPANHYFNTKSTSNSIRRQ